MGTSAQIKRASNGTGADVSKWLSVALEEYDALRVEIIDAIQAQRTIMQVGTAGLSVLIGLGLQQERSPLGVLILAFLVPILAVFVTAGSLGEMLRAARASSFLAHREEIINEVVDGEHPAMEWEGWLRRQPVYIARERAQFLIIFVLSTSSLMLGGYSTYISRLYILPSIVLVFLGLVSVALWLSGPMLHSHLIRQVRRQFLNVRSEPSQIAAGRRPRRPM